jgi:predicted SAM-dependent methyltransferase
MYINGLAYRYLRAPSQGLLRVHLGPGQKKYLTGWINVDANCISAKCDVWADLRNTLPFRTATIDCFYSHHVIEHLPDLPFHFAEMLRCLKPGGVFRVAGPNGDMAIKKYLAGDGSWFGDFPDKRDSLGGKLENFIFCRQEHLTILTFSWVEEIARRAGFQQMQQCTPVSETNYPVFFDSRVLCQEYESTPEAPHTLIVEGRKPI